jgi:hypothetical protein
MKLNFDSSHIYLIILGIILALLLYSQLIQMSTVLVIPTNKTKTQKCNFI